ncbi:MULTISPECIES: response regulator transcription factor [unclassified Microbacterium]|uniref:response regulator transcription factor n=1 Tax=unclassified Microbacterium TaxID=2609290 RepID=UPI000EAA48D8|nr:MULTISPECIES: response regulator transcription factor [unclassified Microbacterium]MBT2483286.1 response regulator transcription factor [Microbacterium sp. ISL-108]RKN66325.1 DNA-binding response regulator [Microbacterium sp. CGR2]
MRIVIAEDSALLREGIAQLLTAEGHQVVAAVADADALMRALGVEEPDLVIVDVRMPPEYVDEGIRAALQIREQHPDVAVLVLSQHVERRYARELLDGRGGVGYLLKDRISDISGFLDAIVRVTEGGVAFDPEVIRRLIADRSGPDPRLSALSERESAVLELIAEGHSNAAIAERLHMSQSGVEKHINTIFTKLGVASGSGVNRRVLAVLAHLDQSGDD